MTLIFPFTFIKGQILWDKLTSHIWHTIYVFYINFDYIALFTRHKTLKGLWPWFELYRLSKEKGPCWTFMALKITFKLHEIQFELEDSSRVTVKGTCVHDAIHLYSCWALLYLLNNIKDLVVNDRPNMTSYITICASNKHFVNRKAVCDLLYVQTQHH